MSRSMSLISAPTKFARHSMPGTMFRGCHRPKLRPGRQRHHLAIADASIVSAARSSGSSECTLVLPQARASIWHSIVRVWRKL